MKNILYILIGSMLMAYNSSAQHKTKQKATEFNHSSGLAQVTPRHKAHRVTLDKEILHLLVAQYGGYTQGIDTNEGGQLEMYKMEENDSEVVVETYTLNDGGKSLMMVTMIPKSASNNPVGANKIIDGDLNGDGKPEIVVTVHYEGGGTAVYGDNIYIYEKAGSKWKALIDVNSNELSGCGDTLSGPSQLFSAIKIDNGLLVGEAYCYTEKDASCCPSLTFENKLRLVNGKLKVVFHSPISRRKAE